MATPLPLAVDAAGAAAQAPAAQAELAASGEVGHRSEEAGEPVSCTSSPEATNQEAEEDDDDNVPLTRSCQTSPGAIHIAASPRSLASAELKWDPVDQRFMFRYAAPGGRSVAFQTTVRKSGGCKAKAEHICRLCYAMFEAGASKENVTLYRDELYAAAWTGASLPEPPAVGPRVCDRVPAQKVLASKVHQAQKKTKGPKPGAAQPAAGGGPGEGFCEVCQRGGRLLLCDKCPRGFHASCIRRYVDREELGEGAEWICPLCSRGAGALSGLKQLDLKPEDMAARMAEAARRDRRQRRAAERRRDGFLAKRLALVETFAGRGALARLQRLAADPAPAALEVGSLVLADGTEARLGLVMAQTSPSTYLVADLGSGAETSLERSRLVPAAVGEAEGPGDLLGRARRPVLAEGCLLKDYQRAGVNWLIHAFHNRCGGILADDMGLGKTVQALAFVSYLRSSGAARGPCLVVAPKGCAGNWVREAHRFVPHLSVGRLLGVARERQHSLEDDETWFGLKDVFITTYDCVVSTEDFFRRHFWSVVILDEAHRIKNQASRVRGVLDSVQSAGRLLLTGTPLQNNLRELFSLLCFLWPDVFAREEEIFDQCTVPTGADKAAAQEEAELPLVGELRAILSLVMLRRSKEDVIKLPPKVVHDIWLPMSACQAHWYRSLLKCRRMLAPRGLRALLKLVVRLRLLSNHPRCLVASAAEREALGQWGAVEPGELTDLAEGPPMSEVVISQSGKLAFLDKLLGHLHEQNVRLAPGWRRAFEERRKACREGCSTTGSSAASCSFERCIRGSRNAAVPRSRGRLPRMAHHGHTRSSFSRSSCPAWTCWRPSALGAVGAASAWTAAPTGCSANSTCVISTGMTRTTLFTLWPHAPAVWA
uniref:Uncharacterized protein n=1 Tax=Alexandrium monilatum TaxID=311494 RepID=A0A7S4ULD4_9DINO